MSQGAKMTYRFDLAALDTLLGPQGFVSALDYHAITGHVHYASVTRDSFDNGQRVRVSANYALGFPGRGRRIYTLLTLDLRVEGGVATVICARRLGRLIKAESMLQPLMRLVKALAENCLPNRAQLEPFMPSSLLDALEGDVFAADFPDEGTDSEEKLPESCWEYPAVLRAIPTGFLIDAEALSLTLNLLEGERAQMVDINAASGDYRAFYVGMECAQSGQQSLTFELHRSGPGMDRRLFNVLSFTFGACDVQGMCTLESFTCELGSGPSELPLMLPGLARIVAALQEGKRPDDALILAFLSKPTQILWAGNLVEGGAA